MPRKLMSIAAALMCAACAHNLPDDADPNRLLGPGLARAYVDMNGAFYPDAWEDVVGRAAMERHHSIYAAIEPASDDWRLVHEQEERWLAELATAAEEHRRIFVFLVGFNANQESSENDMLAMQQAVEVGEDDLVIQFFWDGHNARAVVDAARIWFWGTGSSQVSGQRGLRRILNAVGDRELVIISYSRGASVVLSALSDPEYDDDFVRDTLRVPHIAEAFGPRFFETPPLVEGGDIRVLMLAPAVGEADFWGPAPDNTLRSFRAFPERLASIRYTINPRDYVLNKLWIGLATRLNSTALGAYPTGGRRVDCHYDFLQGYRVHGNVGHETEAYLRDGAFREMLDDSGIQARGAGTVGPAVPIERRSDCDAA